MFSIFDQFILVMAGLSCLFFIAIQVLVFRFIGAAGVLKWLMNVYWISTILGEGLTIFFARNVSAFHGRGPAELVIVFLVSFILYSLMAFLYVLFILGPYESSVRLRIVQEMDRYYPKGCSLAALLQAYNTEIILKRRLGRLMEAGDISYDGHLYHLKKEINLFLVTDRMVAQLNEFINGPKGDQKQSL